LSKKWLSCLSEACLFEITKFLSVSFYLKIATAKIQFPLLCRGTFFSYIFFNSRWNKLYSIKKYIYRNWSVLGLLKVSYKVNFLKIERSFCLKAFSRPSLTFESVIFMTIFVYQKWIPLNQWSILVVMVTNYILFKTRFVVRWCSCYTLIGQINFF